VIAPPAPLRVALAGAGAWGVNLARVLARHPDAQLAAVVDPSKAARAAGRAAGCASSDFASIDEALASVALDAVVVATPAEAHFAVAARALEAGLHVLVEKPLVTSSRDADALVALARRSPGVAMVGHLMLHHPAVRKLVALVREGAIGTPRYLAASRLSPATGHGADSALWALGPHDLSIVHALDATEMSTIRALELAHDDGGVAHAALVHARLASGFGAHVELSRMHAYKERRLAVVGDEAVLVFDDVHPTDKLHLVRVPARATRPFRTFDEFLLLGGRAMHAVDVEMCEPLAEEIDHFVRAARGDVAVRTTIEDGATIVRWLELASRPVSDQR
jgi:predicted dehydrogenase